MIRSATLNDIHTLVYLSESNFGKGFHNKNYFQDIISSEDNSCTVLEIDSIVRGYCTAIKESDDTIRLDAIIVSENYRGKGYATQMIEELLIEFSNCHFVSYVWNQSPENKLPELYKRMGFEKVDSIQDYWYQDSLKKGYSCLVCGNPCRCSADVYKK